MVRLDTSSLQTALVGTGSRLVGAVWWIGSTVKETVARVWGQLQGGGRRTGSKTAAHLSTASRVLGDQMGWAVAGLIGRRAAVSLLLVALAPVLAVATAWWVGSSVGYETLEGWARGTWYGTGPSGFVFGAATVLVALGAAGGALEGGLLPTSLVVSAPVFGAAVTRYATEVTYTWGTTTVSLPNAVGIATLVALAVGIPVSVSGYLLGIAMRRAISVFRDSWQREAGSGS